MSRGLHARLEWLGDISRSDHLEIASPMFLGNIFEGRELSNRWLKWTLFASYTHVLPGWLTTSRGDAAWLCCRLLDNVVTHGDVTWPSIWTTDNLLHSASGHWRCVRSLSRKWKWFLENKLCDIFWCIFCLNFVILFQCYLDNFKHSFYQAADFVFRKIDRRVSCKYMYIPFMLWK